MGSLISLPAKHWSASSCQDTKTLTSKRNKSSTFTTTSSIDNKQSQSHTTLSPSLSVYASSQSEEPTLDSIGDLYMDSNSNNSHSDPSSTFHLHSDDIHVSHQFEDIQPLYIQTCLKWWNLHASTKSEKSSLLFPPLAALIRKVV